MIPLSERTYRCSANRNCMGHWLLQYIVSIVYEHHTQYKQKIQSLDRYIGIQCQALVVFIGVTKSKSDRELLVRSLLFILHMTYCQHWLPIS